MRNDKLRLQAEVFDTLLKQGEPVLDTGLPFSAIDGAKDM